MAAWTKLGLLTGLGGAMSVWAAHKTRRSFGCYADTAFEHHPNIRDLSSSPAYHLVNNFWLPQDHQQPFWNTGPATAFPLHFINQLQNQPVHLEDDDAHEDSFDHGDNFGLLSTGSAVVGSTLFHHGYGRKISIKEAVPKARRMLKKHMQEIGAPGLVVGVSIDGHVVWTEGLGYSDFENSLPCQANTVMRIASISKAISMTIVAKLWEQGLLDLDKPIQEYVPEFPMKTFEGHPVTITCRQLVSHLSGIRHYSKTKKTDEEYLVDPPQNIDKKSRDEKKPTVLAKYNEFDEKEYYLKESFPKVSDALKVFQDDPVLVEPGTEFLYTTYGFTLLSAVIESVTKRKFTENMKDLLRDFDMTNTFLDEHEPIIHNRSR
ncbi:hypothetical protein RvY_02555-2 [Ramazzottius varieornatus]|nr:hypothetical protein RvY_02555-2 [Ramazzottius varieornatus]